MALSAAAHHSFDKVAAGEKYDGLRAQRTDRAREAAYQAPRRPTTRAAGVTELFQLYEDEINGVRPPPLVEVRPQGQLERHTGVGFELVQALEVPVLHRMEVADDINYLQLLRGLAVVPVGSSPGNRRKRKKRRKKKLPKTSSSRSSPLQVRYPDHTIELDVDAGDQGIKFWYVTDGSEEAMLLSHSGATRSTVVRKHGKLWWLWPDGETQATKEYDQRADVPVEPRDSTSVSSLLSRLSPRSLSSARSLRGIPCMENMNKFSTEDS